MIINPVLKTFAITPLKNREVEVTSLGRLAVTSQKHELVEAELVIGSGEYRAGTKVFLVGDAANQPWNGQILTVGTKTFVLCPESAVIAIEG